MEAERPEALHGTQDRREHRGCQVVTRLDCGSPRKSCLARFAHYPSRQPAQRGEKNPPVHICLARNCWSHPLRTSDEEYSVRWAFPERRTARGAPRAKPTCGRIGPEVRSSEADPRPTDDRADGQNQISRSISERTIRYNEDSRVQFRRVVRTHMAA
jgi:hypothetical protein